MTDDVENRRDLRTQIEANLRYVAEHWGDVLQSELKGTKRPWAATRMSEADEMDAAALARIERLERADGLAAAPAPLHVDVLVQVIACEGLVREMRKAARHRLLAMSERLVSEYEATEASA